MLFIIYNNLIFLASQRAILLFLVGSNPLWLKIDALSFAAGRKTYIFQYLNNYVRPAISARYPLHPLTFLPLRHGSVFWTSLGPVLLQVCKIYAYLWLDLKIKTKTFSKVRFFELQGVDSRRLFFAWMKELFWPVL